MDFPQWVVIVGAVLAGNFFTGMFGYSIYQTWKAEREGKDTFRLPLKVYLAAIIPLGIVLFALFMVKPS